MRKYRVLLAAALLLLLAGCQNPAPAPTGPAETTPVTEPVTVPETTSAPEPVEPETESNLYYDLFPKFEDPNWELYDAMHGLYQYTGDMDQIDLPAYSLSIPEDWQDKVTVIRFNPAGSDVVLYVMGNALQEVSKENLVDLENVEARLYYYDGYIDPLITVSRVLKENEDTITSGLEAAQNGHCFFVGEDDDSAYFLNIYQNADSEQRLSIREALIDKIGQEAYDELLDGLLCTLEEAAAMISVTE